jgi:hypothetical protein
LTAIVYQLYFMYNKSIAKISCAINLLPLMFVSTVSARDKVYSKQPYLMFGVSLRIVCLTDDSGSVFIVVIS